jgi:excisionase family DNA binding protein
MEGSALFVGRRETLTRGRLRYCQTEALVALARAKLYHNPLTQLLKRGENLWLRLDHRETLLVEMQDLGRQIDAAYRRFESSPRRDGDAVELQRAQSSTQKLIEEKRSEAERIAAQCHEYYQDVNTTLLELAQTSPSLLPVAKSFRALFPPRDACARFELLQLRALLENALRPPTDEKPGVSPHAHRIPQDPHGLLTAKQAATLLSLSAQTVYRLARQGRLPYIRLQGSLRFQQGELENWLRTKSFNPAGGKKSASAGSPFPPTAPASGVPARSTGSLRPASGRRRD